MVAAFSSDLADPFCETMSFNGAQEVCFSFKVAILWNNLPCEIRWPQISEGSEVHEDLAFPSGNGIGMLVELGMDVLFDVVK